MGLAAGVRLGPYQIVAPLGAGGFGEVYEARDMRLNRTVAIKVLSAHSAGASEFHERFHREARAIAQLDHPHICAVHDIGEEDGQVYLVMQYLEGETLDKRLSRGALPLAEALRYGVEIADELQGARAAGIVHRDLKPANIMLTGGGMKLLDFGLAKSGASTNDASGMLLSTKETALTAEGSAPREVFRTGTTTTGVFAESDEYSVSGDGQHWLFIETVPDVAAASLTVVTNWSETLATNHTK